MKAEIEFLAVAASDDIPPGSCRPVDAGGTAVIVAHLADGFYAVENRCSHLNSRLMTREIYRGRQIACPIHGARFDLKTGEAKSPPAFRPIRTFSVRVAGGKVEVGIPRSPSNHAGDDIDGQRQDDRVEKE
jgi:3-phenylpropionate/trans-cinnamate dioxygenase ferredoxin subunit